MRKRLRRGDHLEYVIVAPGAPVENGRRAIFIDRVFRDFSDRTTIRFRFFRVARVAESIVHVFTLSMLVLFARKVRGTRNNPHLAP